MEGQDRAKEGERGRKTCLSTVNCTPLLYYNYMQREKKVLLIG